MYVRALGRREGWKVPLKSRKRPSEAVSIFKISLYHPLTTSNLHSHRWRFSKKTTLPWNQADTSCNTDGEKEDNTPSLCQSSQIWKCTWWKQKPLVGRRAEELQLKRNKTGHRLSYKKAVESRWLCEQRRLKVESKSQFSIWFLFDVTVNISTKKSTETMRSGQIFFCLNENKK